MNTQSEEPIVEVEPVAEPTTDLESPNPQTVAEQDSEASPLEVVKMAHEELAESLTGKLFDTVSGLNAPLSKERDAKETEARTLRTQHTELQPRVEAQQRILAGEVDRAVAEGRDDDAEAKRQESAELQNNLGNILAQAESAEQRVKELARKMGQNYIEVYKSHFPEICSQCILAEMSLVFQLLNKVWSELLRYQGESGLLRGDPPIVFCPDSHKQLLTPDDRGVGRLQWQSLADWFGGGR